MIRKALVIMVIILLAFNGVALAASGEVVMENTIYGGIIGGMLGGAWYLLDQDDAGKKLGTGVGVGIIAGFLLGLTDVGSFVEIEYGNPDQPWYSWCNGSDLNQDWRIDFDDLRIFCEHYLE